MEPSSLSARAAILLSPPSLSRSLAYGARTYVYVRCSTSSSGSVPLSCCVVQVHATSAGGLEGKKENIHTLKEQPACANTRTALARKWLGGSGEGKGKRIVFHDSLAP